MCNTTEATESDDFELVKCMDFPEDDKNKHFDYGAHKLYERQNRFSTSNVYIREKEDGTRILLRIRVLDCMHQMPYLIRILSRYSIYS